jgi:hypothetical protein
MSRTIILEIPSGPKATFDRAIDITGDRLPVMIDDEPVMGRVIACDVTSHALRVMVELPDDAPVPREDLGLSMA